MNATDLFLSEHARAHAAALGANADMPFPDFIFGLPDDDMRRRPQPGTNSLAWLLWHMARGEDMAVNVLVAGRPQVIEGDGWLERLGLARVDIGTGMNDDEVEAFTASVDVDAIRSYRTAVGARTREVVTALPPERFAAPVDAALLRRAFAEGAIAPEGGWLRGFLQGKTNEFVLCHAALRHNFMHIGEAMCVRSLLGVGLPV
jgi:hypothetical protein